MPDPYSDREQTKAKHFILKRYLQALAFKVLRFYDITYVDWPAPGFVDTRLSESSPLLELHRA